MQERESKLNFTTAFRHIVTIAFLVAALLSLQVIMVFTQTRDSGSGQGRNSQQGELQRDPKPERQTGSPRMGQARPPAAASINSKKEKMEDALAQPRAIATGNQQQKVDITRAANPPQGGGKQQRKETGAPSGSHMRLVLRVTERGGAQVLHATEIAGEAVISDEPVGTFVYEVTGSGQTLAVQAIPDPFEMRSFSGQQDAPTQGHHIARARTATVGVDVPKTNLALASAVESNLVVRIYKIKPGALIDKINPATLQKLKQENRLEIRVDLPASTLAPEIRQKGRKLGSQ